MVNCNSLDWWAGILSKCDPCRVYFMFTFPLNVNLPLWFFIIDFKAPHYQNTVTCSSIKWWLKIFSSMIKLLQIITLLHFFQNKDRSYPAMPHN
jgi:hypothetical protein